jgi:flagellar biosynthetic protein FliQ
MNELTLLEVTRNAVMTMLLVSAPLLVCILVVGLVVSVFQAVTQVNEQTLVFVPKMIVAFVVLLVAGPWMANQMLRFTVDMFTLMPSLTR